jgi:hypothetical protein
MRVPWPAALAALLGGALVAGAVDWRVMVRRAEAKSAPEPFAKPVAEIALGEDFEGVEEGEWVRVTEEGKSGWFHRSAVGTDGEHLKDPFLAFRITGDFYPVDVQEADAEVRAWVLHPVVRTTSPAPRAIDLETFRAEGGLGGVK